MTTENISDGSSERAGSEQAAPGSSDSTSNPYAGSRPDQAGPRPDEGPVPLRRARYGQILGGVAAGLASYLDLDVAIVRILIVVLALMGGAGVPLYLAAWLLIPEEGTERSVLADILHPQPA